MKGILCFLGELNDADIDWLATTGRKLKLAPGGELIVEGEHRDQLPIILEGEFDLATAAEPSPGAAPGLVVGHESTESSTDARKLRARTAAVVLTVPVAALRRKLQDNPQFAARFSRALSKMRAHHAPAKASRRHGGAHGRAEFPDPLGMDVMDSVHLAGVRFHHLLTRLQPA